MARPVVAARIVALFAATMSMGTFWKDAVDPRLHAENPQLRGDVFSGESPTASGRGATLEEIRREEAKMSVDLVRRDRRRSRRGLREHGRGRQAERE